ncbi:ComF family protein [Candidatus Falkowbacteria bacterium]|nr:ComF family protein [Candidatus Falkowbacteria bacterium]
MPGKSMRPDGAINSNKRIEILKGKIGKSLSCLFDFVFPPVCLECGRRGEWLCAACKGSLWFRPNQDCLVCGKPNENGESCWICRETAPLRHCWAAYSYKQKPAVALVKRIKYEFISKAGETAAELLIEFVLEKRINEALPKNVCVVPVPLHWHRYCWRGFNQSALLAQPLAQHFGWSFEPRLLQRIKSSKPQAMLSREERLKNLADHFEVNKRQEIKNKHILLVDDVVTTGGTMIECAKALKAAGAKSVCALTLLRG